MVTRKTTSIAFIGILITAWIIVFVTHVEAETTDEQKQALIGEWKGVWPGPSGDTLTLIIHEIDTAKAKARCTTISSVSGEKTHLADFIPGPNPKLELKPEGNDLKFILKNKVLQGTFKGMRGGTYISNSISMEKKQQK